MPKMPYQKLKLLTLQKFLYESSDENHPVTIKDMINALERAGINAERKSLYDDLEQLRTFGDDVVSVKLGSGAGYYIGARSFEISELKLLVDAVQGSKFITQKKSVQLIKKLESLCSKYQAASLSRQVLVTNRIKSMNESIYYNVDKLHAAIGNDSSITFKYFDYDLDVKRVLRRDGALYHVSPFALNWDDENYYLIAFDHAYQMIRHYRVDKMLDIKLTREKREGKAEFQSIDIERYSKKVFSMFGGEEVRVGIEFDNSLAGAVIDRFGRDVSIRKSDNPGKFYISTAVAISPHFYGWLFSFGTMARLISPQSAVDDFKRYTKEVLDQS